jgi:hypothetical protein
MWKKGELLVPKDSSCGEEHDNHIFLIKEVFAKDRSPFGGEYNTNSIMNGMGAIFHERQAEKYTGPIYEKDGQRFVPSGEDVFVAPMGHVVECKGLLPVPELEPVVSVGDKFEKDGVTYVYKGEKRQPMPGEHYLYVPKMEVFKCKDAKSSWPIVEPEHEFKVGDWVKFDKEKIMQIIDFDKVNKKVAFCRGEGKYGNHIERMEKLPGRPLTTEDLMQVLSGKKVMVECHACMCADKPKVTSRLFISINNDIVHFAHTGEVAKIALFTNGEVKWTDGVEGNIFVVEEGD